MQIAFDSFHQVLLIIHAQLVHFHNLLMVSFTRLCFSYLCVNTDWHAQVMRFHELVSLSVSAAVFQLTNSAFQQ
jgi:hypothetical protein